MKIPKIFKSLGIIIFQFSVMFGAIILCLLLIVWGLLVLASQPPHRITETWQTITISYIGTFRVPTEWNVEEHDEFLYITDNPMADGDYTIYIIGTNNRIRIPSHALFEDMERVETRASSVFSNGAALSLSEYIVDGAIQNHHVISFTNSSTGALLSYGLFAWDYEVVNEWYAEQIARTFSPTRQERFDRENFGRLVQ